MANNEHILLEPEHLARLKSLQLKAKSVVEGVLSGLHKSPHHGSSVEFAEHKEYAPGDEIKHIDWRVYAKSDKYYVKHYEQETNLQAMLLLDASSSMLYKSNDGLHSKWEYASIIAASVAYLLLRQQDSVGLSVVGSDVTCFVPPRNRSTHLMHLCKLIVSSEPQPNTPTDLLTGVKHITEVFPRRGLVFVFSDFFDNDPEFMRVLRQLKGRRQQVHLFHVLDPWELTFPFEQMTLFQSMESVSKVLAEPRAMRATYLRAIQAFIQNLRKDCLEHGMEYHLLDTSVAIDDAIGDFVMGKKNISPHDTGQSRHGV
ncbi:MAG TPA: DUF58 domain-containing protein [Myxococcales bacterium]|nr:DUF58 domain-containing protein [Myxococcales bacterium]HIN85414.1 DUF58 domain-containing protein [Myxococcales bacterium]